MTRQLFALLDKVYDRAPLGASLRYVHLSAPPQWALETASTLVASWTAAEQQKYRAQLAGLAGHLAVLHSRWVVAAALALMLGFTVVIAAMTGGQLNEANDGVLTAVLTAILLPPFTICHGIARDYAAAQALLTVCGVTLRAQPR
ncbi:MAG: hypothetical protein RLZZ387_3993 [Chloroflexota bacterium]|jgi:hypothetical protein